MKRKSVKLLKIVIPLLLGVFLIWFSYQKFTPAQLDEIKNYFTEANYSYVLLAVVLGILSNLSRAYRWGLLFTPLGYQTTFKNKVMAVYITYLMNLFIPRSGEVSRALVINKYEDVPFDKAFGTVISERAADAVVLLSLILITFGLQFDLLKSYLGDYLNPTKLLWVGSVLAVLVLVLFWYLKTAQTAFKKKVMAFLLGLREGVLSIFTMKQKGAFILHTLFIWVLYFMMFYVVIFALPETSTIPMEAVLTAFVMGGIVITLTNSGFGSYPFVMAAILALFHVPETAGTAFGWIVWSSQTLTTIVFGALSFLLLPILNKV